jgi:hypothetical protein
VQLKTILYLLGLESVLLKNVDLINDISGQLLVCLRNHMSNDGKAMMVSSVFQNPQGDDTGRFNMEVSVNIVLTCQS